MSSTLTIHPGESWLYDMEVDEPPLRDGETLTAMLEASVDPATDLTISELAASGDRMQFRIAADLAVAAGTRSVRGKASTSLGNTVRGQGFLKVVALP